MKIKNLLLSLIGSILLVGSIGSIVKAQVLVSCSAINKNTGIIENKGEICKGFYKEDSSYRYFTYIWNDGIKTRIKISKNTGAAVLIDKNSPVKVAVEKIEEGYIMTVYADTYIMVFGIPGN